MSAVARGKVPYSSFTYKIPVIPSQSKRKRRVDESPGHLANLSKELIVKRLFLVTSTNAPEMGNKVDISPRLCITK